MLADSHKLWLFAAALVAFLLHRRHSRTTDPHGGAVCIVVAMYAVVGAIAVVAVTSVTGHCVTDVAILSPQQVYLLAYVLVLITLFGSTLRYARRLTRGSVLPAAGVESIATHKYVSGAYTPLDNILNPFWLWATARLPLWIAPNAVTATGGVGSFIAYVLLWHYAPTFTEPLPVWVMLVTGTLLWCYQTLDAMDGKQARRTGSSSPLGQLFDHGCDCASTIVAHSVGTVAGGFGRDYRLTVGCLVTMQSLFFLAQWAEYHTHVLKTAYGPVGVTELQYYLVFLAVVGCVVDLSEATQRMVTLAVGETVSLASLLPTWISSSLPSSLTSLSVSSVPASLQFSVTLKQGELIVWSFLVFAVVMSVIGLAQTLQYILTHVNGKRRKGAKGNKTRKATGVAAALAQLTSPALLCMLALTLPSSLYAAYPRLVVVVVGVVYVHLTNTMIVASMAKTRFPVLSPLLLPFATTHAALYALPVAHTYMAPLLAPLAAMLASVSSSLSLLSPLCDAVINVATSLSTPLTDAQHSRCAHAMLWTLLAAETVWLFAWHRRVVKQLCARLKIKCFSIPLISEAVWVPQ